MGQTTHQIEAHIADTREKLGNNVRELEQKVKAVTDWKQYVQNSPMSMFGVALGGGILLATMLGRPKTHRLGEQRDLYSAPGVSEEHPGDNDPKDKALETWNNIKGALIGVAATRFKEFIGEVVPGFQEQFKQAEENDNTHETTVV